MGFDVNRQTGIVTVDHSHNQFATTSVAGNPHVKEYKGLKVIGIFKRNKGATKRLKADQPKTKIEGDNSPMLYALKKMDGLSTTRQDVLSLFKNAKQILINELSSQKRSFDIIISIPSSHKLSVNTAQLTARVCLNLGHQSTRCDSILKKASASDVKQQIKSLDIKSKLRTQMLASVNSFIKNNSDDTDFQIKSIGIKLRKYVNPLTFAFKGDVNKEEFNVLLVDDMVTTGSSLIAARDLLLQRYPNANVYAVCLFSAS